MKEFSRREKKSEPVNVRPATELITSSSNEPTAPKQSAAPSAADVERDQMGMINRLRLRNAESAHQLERARLAYRTEMQLFTHQSEAAIRESRATSRQPSELWKLIGWIHETRTCSEPTKLHPRLWKRPEHHDFLKL
jgi:hypothetical protein